MGSITESTSSSSQRRSPYEDLRSFLHEMAAAHLFGVIGLVEQQEKFQRMLAESAASGTPDPMIHVGNGSPASSDWAPYAMWRLAELPERVAPGGQFSTLLGQLWIVTVYTAWEHGYRKVIAGELGHSQPEDLVCDEMGDLRHMRNDIVHHRGVATADNTGRCRVLQWSQVDQQISIGPPHVEQFMVLIGKRLAAWQDDDSS